MAYIYHCHLLPYVLRRFLSPCAHATRPATPRTPPPPCPMSVVATASHASAVPTPPHAPTTSRRHYCPATPARRAATPVPYPRRVDTARRRGRQRARAASSPSFPRYAACSFPSPGYTVTNRSMMRTTLCLLRSYSISMHETHVLGKFTHGNRTYCCSHFLFLRACSSIDTVATKTLVVTLVCIRTYVN